MEKNLWLAWLQMRTADIRMMVPTYVAFSFGMLVLLSFGYDHVANMKWQTAIVIVVVNLWALLINDGVIADIAAGAEDMDPTFEDTALGREYKKAPLALFRVIFAAGAVLFAIAELAALYR
jgi:hypothetical protein